MVVWLMRVALAFTVNVVLHRQASNTWAKIWDNFDGEKIVKFILDRDRTYNMTCKDMFQSSLHTATGLFSDSLYRQGQQTRASSLLSLFFKSLAQVRVGPLEGSFSNTIYIIFNFEPSVLRNSCSPLTFSYLRLSIRFASNLIQRNSFNLYFCSSCPCLCPRWQNKIHLFIRQIVHTINKICD